MSEHEHKKHAPDDAVSSQGDDRPTHRHSDDEFREPLDDVNFEPEEELGDIGAARGKLKKLREELEKVKKERQEFLDGWQRCKADSINAKREAAQTFERTLAASRETLVEDIIPIIDSFDMAAGTPVWESVDENWRAGMDQIRNQLLDVLSRYGVERYGKVGDIYSPHLHEAAQEVDDIAGEPGSIVRILRYGFKTTDRVVRPAHVVIKAG